MIGRLTQKILVFCICGLLVCYNVRLTEAIKNKASIFNSQLVKTQEDSFVKAQDSPITYQASEDNAFLIELTKDTWTYLNSDWATDNHLPWSWRSESQPLAGDYANPTEIGFYALSWLAAYNMGESWSPNWTTTESEVSAILDQLRAWQTDPLGENSYNNSVFYQWYWINDSPPSVGGNAEDKLVPSIDNAWLAASLISIREYAQSNGHNMLAQDADDILTDMDFSIWYHPDTHRFSWGAIDDPQGGAPANHYSNENRIINFIARALGDLDSKEFALSLAALERPSGIYDGIIVDRMAYDGSYFTYTSPALFIGEMQTFYGSNTINPATEAQIQYASNSNYQAWGLSDCFDIGTGPYIQQGAPPDAMSGSPETRAGLVSPHASALALNTSFETSALENLEYISNNYVCAYNDTYGFFESVVANQASAENGQCSDRFSALNQEWIFLSLANYFDGFVWKYFYKDEGVVTTHAEMYERFANWSGSVTITSNQSVIAVGRPHVGDEVLTYNGFANGITNAYVPMLFKDAFGGSYDSALYVQNIDPSNPANITIRFYDSSGVQTHAIVDTLSPLASKGYWLPNISALGPSWVGGVKVVSDRNIVAVGRPHIGTQVLSYNGFTSGSTNAYVPMLFKDAFGGSYDSALYVQNIDPSNPANIIIRFYDSNGDETYSMPDTIQPLASKGYWLPAIAPLGSSWVGGVKVESDQDIVAVGRPHIGTQVLTYNGFTGGDLNAYVPMLFKDAFGGSYDSALYIQNLDTTNAANITIRFYDSSGNETYSTTDNISALASKGYWLPAIAPLGTSWVGGVKVESDRDIVAVGRPHVGSQVMAYNGFVSGSTNAYVPMLFRDAFGGSYDSALYVQNLDPSNTADVTILFYDANGDLSCTVNDTIPALASKGWWLPGLNCTP